MSNDEPIAAVTVRFDRGPIMGRLVAGLVQQVVAARTDSPYALVAKQEYDDRDVVSLGYQSSPAESVRVVPSRDGKPAFALQGDYVEAHVISHWWDGARDAVMISDCAYVEGTKDFAAALQTAYQAALQDGFPDYIVA